MVLNVVAVRPFAPLVDLGVGLVQSQEETECLSNPFAILMSRHPFAVVLRLLCDH